MEAAPAATPPNPKIAATTAISRKINIKRNISVDLWVEYSLLSRNIMPIQSTLVYANIY